MSRSPAPFSAPRLVCGALVSALLLASCGDAPATTAAAAPTKPVVAEPAKPVVDEPAKPAVDEPTKPTEPAAAGPDDALTTIGDCNEQQAKIAIEANERAKPWSIAQHLAKNFPDMKVSWLMKETPYQDYVVKTGAKNFGRCNDTGCYLFAAPTALMTQAVEKATTGETHDPAVLGEALGLPAKNFEGPLRMMTLDLAATKSCVRLPVDDDPGVWKCQSEADTDCFKFGGYTSGNVPEVMVIDAPVDQAVIQEIP